MYYVYLYYLYLTCACVSRYLLNFVSFTSFTALTRCLFFSYVWRHTSVESLAVKTQQKRPKFCNSQISSCTFSIWNARPWRKAIPRFSEINSSPITANNQMSESLVLFCRWTFKKWSAQLNGFVNHGISGFCMTSFGYVKAGGKMHEHPQAPQ